ncbi:MAG: M14 family zinc carboxypeptidase [Planctomycetota bacterium]
MTTRYRLAAAALAIGAGCSTVARAEVAPAGAQAKYRTHAQLSTAVDRLVADHPRACVAESIGTSREGRAIWALRLALGGEVEPDRRPAMLLAANIDGDHLLGSAVALEVAGRLLTLAGEGDEAAVTFLSEHTLYVVPRVAGSATSARTIATGTARSMRTRPTTSTATA